MKILVLYHSTTGNTKKIATAIAKQAGVQAESITETTSVQDADLLFIGDGIYGGKVNAKTQKLLLSLNRENVGCVAVFGTYGGQANAIQHMKATLQNQNINVLEETFGCKGRAWLVVNYAHPNAEDIRQAKLFTRRAIEKCES